MKKKLPLILLILILLLAAFMRLYLIHDYMTFLGDEGRDVLVAKHMLEGEFTLLGPRSSAGDFFMGPAYYYMITPFLWLSGLDPVGPAIMVALFGVATVYLIYFVGKKFFNEKTGLFAAALYAVSPIIINYSHSSWNPNVLPFFSLLLMYVLYQAVEKKTWKYFLFAGFLLGISLQLHYLALSLCVITVVYLFISEWFQQKKKRHLGRLMNQYAQLLGGFIIGFSPFLAFEVRHSFLNIKAILAFIFGEQTGTDLHGLPFHAVIGDVFFRIFGKLVFFFPPADRYSNFDPIVLQVFGIGVVAIALASVYFLFRAKDKRARLLLLLWLIIGVGLFGFYKKSIYDYHFAFLFPLPFLLVGYFLSLSFRARNEPRNLIPKKLLGGVRSLHSLRSVGMTYKVLSVVLFIGIFLYNLNGMPFRYMPNKQREQVKVISEFVISKSDNKPFNFALITGGNSDHAYRYYMEVLGHKPVNMENFINDPDRKTVTDQLLIVCEDVNCHPLGHSQFEVAGFGRAEIVGEWQVRVVKVYKLVPYKEKN